MPVTNYIWDDENDSYLMETDEAGVTTAVYTNEPAQFGNLISQRRGNQTTYYHYDALGSTRELTDDNEDVVNTNVYDAWGLDVASSVQTDNCFKFNGELAYYSNAELGVVYVRSRPYVPARARWLCADPLFFGDAANRYAYARNSPIIRNDPLGLIDIASGNIVVNEGSKVACRLENNRCCVIGPPGEGYLQVPGVRFTFTDADKSSRIMVFQEVRTRATMTCACRSCGDCQNAEEMRCHPIVFSVEHTFVETLTPFGSGSFVDDGNADGVEDVQSFIAKSCAKPCHPCCEWSYEKHTTKTIAYGQLRDRDGRFYFGRFVSRLRPQMSLDCGGCGPKADVPFHGVGYPTDHTMKVGLSLPSGASTRTRRFSVYLYHAKCAEFGFVRVSAGEFR